MLLNSLPKEHGGTEQPRKLPTATGGLPQEVSTCWWREAVLPKARGLLVGSGSPFKGALKEGWGCRLVTRSQHPPTHTVTSSTVCLSPKAGKI